MALGRCRGGRGGSRPSAWPVGIFSGRTVSLLLVGGRGLEDGRADGAVESADEDRQAVDVGDPAPAERVLCGREDVGGVGLEDHDVLVGLDLPGDGGGGRLLGRQMGRRRRRRLHLEEVRPVGRGGLPLRAAVARELVGHQLIPEVVGRRVEADVHIKEKKSPDSSRQSAADGLD